MIVKVGPRQFWLYDRAGKRVLGKHATHAKAAAQEAAINISKARVAGHHIPPKRRRG
jgi:sarcosine oxidase gamma subunit